MAEEPGRLATGVAGLDEVLGGGLPRGSTTLLVGPPGAGKTVLAAQLAFAHAQRGERALFVTLLVESHERLARHLGSFSFFDPTTFGDRLVVVSGSKELLEGGTAALLSLVQREVHRRRASFAVLDGVSAVAVHAGDPVTLQSFLYELSAVSSVSGCTTLLVHARTGSAEAPSPEGGLVDGVLELSDVRGEGRRLRGLEVCKLRGSTALRGIHAFDIDERGAAVYPRLESRQAPPPLTAAGDERVSLGLPELDAMVDGGAYRGSVTAVAGPAGSGKTLLGLSFLAEGVRQQESSLYLGFGEPPVQLAREAAQAGLDLQAGEGVLDVEWRRPDELILHRLGNELLARVDARGTRRLFLDGFATLRKASAFPGRLGAFFAALMSELASRGVTTVVTHEMSLVHEGPDATFDDVAALADNLLLLRYAEAGGSLLRLLSVLKARGSAHDPRTWELIIASDGLELKEAPPDRRPAIGARLEGRL